MYAAYLMILSHITKYSAYMYSIHTLSHLSNDTFYLLLIYSSWQRPTSSLAKLQVGKEIMLGI